MQRARGEFAEAAELCRQALEHAQTAARTGDPDAGRAYRVAKAREGLARALHGESPLASLPAYDEAVRSFDDVLRFGTDNAFIEAERAALLAARGLALADAGRTQDAIAQLESSLASFASVGPEDELNAEVRQQVTRARDRLAELRRSSP